MWFRSPCHLPELICYKNHTTLQEERSKDPDDLTNTEALEKAFEVHVFQARVHGPPQLNDLNTSNKHQSASLVRTDSARGTWHPSPGPPALLHAFLLRGRRERPPSSFANWGWRHSTQWNGVLHNSLSSHSSSQNTVMRIKSPVISEGSIILPSKRPVRNLKLGWGNSMKHVTNWKHWSRKLTGLKQP